MSTAPRILVVDDDPEIRKLLARYAADPARCLYIDDRHANLTPARALGMNVHHFVDAAGLAGTLLRLGLLSGGQR